MDRCLFMVGNIGEDIYLMGGQTSLYDESTAIADVWRSLDGGVSWTQLDDVLAVDDRILRVSGSLNESRVWGFFPE